MCLLHTNELLSRHLFEALDGSTSGPRGFSGSIGRQLKTCFQHPVTSFKTVRLTEPLSNLDPEELSIDQQYLLEFCYSISNGDCSVDLASRNRGCLNHSRWLTTANRILRSYVSKSNPSDKLQTLVTFIIRLYASTCLKVKAHSSCKYGAGHFHAIISWSRYLSPKYRNIIDLVIHRNAYFAHPENILLAMITDHRLHIQELGLRRIMKARAAKPNIRTQRFKVPTNLNFNAGEHYEVIDWSELAITEPPVVNAMTDTELWQFIRMDETPTKFFPKFPYHTQAVERLIKGVTEASKNACRPNSRGGFIRARLASGYIIPTFELKRDFTHFVL